MKITNYYQSVTQQDLWLYYTQQLRFRVVRHVHLSLGGCLQCSGHDQDRWVRLVLLETRCFNVSFGILKEPRKSPFIRLIKLLVHKILRRC